MRMRNFKQSHIIRSAYIRIHICALKTANCVYASALTAYAKSAWKLYRPKELGERDEVREEIGYSIYALLYLKTNNCVLKNVAGSEQNIMRMRTD